MKVDEEVAADRRGCDSLGLEENKVCISSESKLEGEVRGGSQEGRENDEDGAENGCRDETYELGVEADC